MSDVSARIVHRRLVYQLDGFDLASPEQAHARFVHGLRRFERTWGATAVVSPPAADDDLTTWSVTARGPNWEVATAMRLVRWDDVIAGLHAEPARRRLPRFLHAFASFLWGGALWGYLRTNPRYAAFFLYPAALLALVAVAAILAGVGAARLTGLPALGVAAGLAAGALGYGACHRWAYLSHLLDDWIFAHELLAADHPVLGPRLERVAEELIREAEAGRHDEILVVGHSLGAVLAVILLEQVLGRRPGLAGAGTPVAFLSLGSSILKVGLHRGAGALRGRVAALAGTQALFWADYQSVSDIMSFYRTDPVRALGLVGPGSPVVRSVRASRMLDEATYRRVRRNLFRIHCQYVRGNQRRADYDYYMFAVGPLRAEDQARSGNGAQSAFGAEGALLGPAPPAPGISSLRIGLA